MKSEIIRDLKRHFTRPRTEEEYYAIIKYLADRGIAVGNLYQELQMSSNFVNFHTDTTYASHSISIHSHSFYEVVFCRSSDRVEYLVGSDRYRLRSGDVIIVAPGISHSPILPERMQYPYERDILWVTTDFMSKVAHLFPNTKIINVNGISLLRTRGTRWDYIGDYFTEGIRESENENLGTEEASSAIALLILTHLYRAISSGETRKPRAEKPTLINSIIEHIESNIDSHLTLDSVAAHFYVSRGTINRVFHDTMGTSFHRFLTQRRLILSKSLISEGEGLEAVAERCGFSDYSVFYKAFKKEYGLSPREFSKMI